VEKRGFFFVIDGIDGSGKTTQVDRLAEALRRWGLEVLTVREPGATAVGEAVREILLDRRQETMSLKTELLLYMAGRAQLVDQVICPALDRGETVVSDRFLSASVAYQAYGGGLCADDVRAIGTFATSGVVPDTTFVLDLDVREAFGRLKALSSSRKLRAGDFRRVAQEVFSWALPDRIEARSLDYYDRVRRGFLELARSDAERFRIIDSSRPIDRIASEIEEIARNVMERRNRA